MDCVLCRLAVRPAVLIALGIVLLMALWLGRAWLLAVLIAYLGLIVLLGLIALALVGRRVLVKLCWKWQADPKGAGSVGHPKSHPVHIPASIYKRPDPLLYSQPWLVTRGLAVTWDNPDITVFEVQGSGLPPKMVPPHALLPNKDHLIRARIWNGAVDAPAVNLLVRFHYLTFGIGAHRETIGEVLVPDLPVKGAAGLPRVAEMAWKTPALSGHYCVQVELVWTDDADQGNNVGQTNLDVKKLNSPNASFTFPLRNDGVLPARLRLTTDAYRLPPLDSCDEDATGRRLRRIGRHLPEGNRLPSGWQVAISGVPDGAMEAGEERPITVKVTAVDGFAGELDINVNAFDGQRLVGGVTLRVHS
ncbi:MAG TPA: hypothetical protein VGB76_18115 [Pyrinomonadaceae bacterium]|jgi:hypothetical protein